MSPLPTPQPVVEVLDDDMVRVLRGKSPAERLAMVDGMLRFARRTLHHHLASQHPDWDPSRLEREVAHRISHGAV